MVSWLPLNLPGADRVVEKAMKCCGAIPGDPEMREGMFPDLAVDGDGDALLEGDGDLLRRVGGLGEGQVHRGLIGSDQRGDDGSPFIDLLVDVRTKLRAAKQYEMADEIRSRLTDLGVLVEDNPGGSSWTYQ